MDHCFSTALEAAASPVEVSSSLASQGLAWSGGSLLDPRFEFDSCGVGFVASLGSEADHPILEHALTALARLAHRGAVAADGASSDGVGVMTGIPRELLLRTAGLSLEEGELLGVGMVFAPPGEARVWTVLEECLRGQGCDALGWREVPIQVGVLGEIALSTMPVIRQVMVRGGNSGVQALEKQLYLARKAFERAVLSGGGDGVCVLVVVADAGL